ncbi:MULTISPECIES: hypothetical protein [unclassified Micromonospora]|uniref:hypothetical protein n=1 Tax=unclassified Micromonospora TaxID=2617518 RepID=UPI003A876C23
MVGRDHLVEANSRIAAARSAVSISGPGLAGPPVGWLGAPLTLIVSAAGMLLSALGTLRIRTVEVVRPEATDLDLSTSGIGSVLSAMACGGFVGALLAGRLIARIGPGPAIWLAPLCTAPAAALLPATATGVPRWLTVAGLALLSFGGVVRLIAQAGLQQRVTPDRLLGRMSGATVRFVQWGSMPVAALLGGALGGLFGASAVLWIGTAGMTAAFLPALLSPLRATDQLPENESTAAQ